MTTKTAGGLLFPLVAALCAGCGGGEAPGGEEGRADRREEMRTGVYGRAPEAVAGIPSVVVARPMGEGEPSPVTSHPSAVGQDAVIDQFGLAFSPRLLIVDPTRTLTFTNSEGALTHNVHLRSVGPDATVFNADAAAGDAVSTVLGESGGYDVLCDMHPGMTAFVFATEAPYAVFAEPDGAFALGELPPGRWELRAWTRAAGWGAPDTVSVAETPTEVDLTASR